MSGSALRPLDRLHRKPLPACAAALFTLASPASVFAADWIVNSCDQGNSGDLPSRTGTLRFAVENAASGDNIDMTALACGKISLSTGSIRINQHDLAIFGPGSGQLAIDGKFVQNANTYSDKDRIIRHSGTGTLAIYGLSLTSGDVRSTTGDVRGGCLLSNGDVYLYDVAVRTCSAKTSASARIALGGAIYTLGDLTAYYSVIASSNATSASTGNAGGGGAFTNGALVINHATIDSNTATGGPLVGVGGGAVVSGNASIFASTISNNVAGRNAGGIDVFNYTPGALVTTISDSTVSGNSAGYLVGGVFADSGHVTIENSTIAFNKAAVRSRSGDYTNIFAAGVTLSALHGSIAVNLQSTLIANNTVKNKEWDLSAPYADPPTTTVTFSAAPANNLVRSADTATAARLPADTSTACPLLGPLRGNGGFTATHALYSTSAAIDAGNDIGAFDFDQRDDARVSGTFADIGAYEVQQDDIVFNAGFDGCPALP